LRHFACSDLLGQLHAERVHHSLHRSDAAEQHYHSTDVAHLPPEREPDISPDYGWRIPMRNSTLADLAALSRTAGVAPMADAYATGFVPNPYHSGSYDNTGHRSGETGLEGGGG
jgi:hypothetical protein